MIAAGKLILDSRSFIELIPILNTSKPAGQWLFFSSPSAVALFMSQHALEGEKIGVIGSGTASRLRSFGVEPDFEPRSTEPETAVEAFARAVKPGEHVIYATSNKSLNRLSAVFDSKNLIHWPFYTNTRRENTTPSQAPILVFTSPSNAVNYFGSHRKRPDQKVIAIGKSTASALAENGVRVDAISEAPSEEKIWKA
ncbi:MAG TPA: uroporphyrinogen-III synthase, partial [Cryomorphaceae bacterium]|nr:uroporphyrinogen-III synthase [Cryomorphaceae bacterium]